MFDSKPKTVPVKTAPAIAQKVQKVIEDSEEDIAPPKKTEPQKN